MHFFKVVWGVIIARRTVIMDHGTFLSLLLLSSEFLLYVAAV